MDPLPLRLTAEQGEKLHRIRGEEPAAFYPAKARDERVDGYVSVELVLNETGSVLEARVIRESPAGMGFGLAALDTTKTWEFDNPFKRLVVTEVVVAFQP